MSRVIVLIIGFIAGWFLKDSNWQAWLEKLKAGLAPNEKTEKPIPLIEEKAVKVETAPDTEFSPDNLELLKGIGTVSKEKLSAQGINTFAQVAALSPDKLKEIAGARVKADEIIQQAKELSR